MKSMSILIIAHSKIKLKLKGMLCRISVCCTQASSSLGFYDSWHPICCITATYCPKFPLRYILLSSPVSFINIHISCLFVSFHILIRSSFLVFLEYISHKIFMLLSWAHISVGCFPII